MMEFILSHVEKGVMTLTLNRPERLNSFNDEMHAQLAECLKQVERDDTIRCLLLTGAGRGFCAGQDLNDRNVDPTGPAPDLGMSVERFYNPLVRRLAKLPKPVICAVNGVAAGAGATLAAEVVEQLCELTLSWGKQPVRCHSTPGFIVNRVARPYYSEAWRALEEQVAAPEVIDAALRDGAGFPMGPLELTDLIGQDVNFAVTCSVFNAFWQERRFLPSLVQQELVIGGRLGKKSGLGVYDWRAEREAVVGLEAVSDSFSPMKVEKKSDGVTEIDDVLLIETQGETAQALAIRLARPVVVVDKMAGKVVTIAAAAVNPDSATRKAIYYLQQQGKTVLQIADYPGMLIWRTVAMIINEALDALQKGVASEQDIDTAMRLGVNYPYGPLAWGAQLGWQRILRLLENLQHHYGEERYRPCSLLRQRALLESGYES
ncbi:TPA: 3-hydroxybutyryl-CoA dehydrogenase [Escherichia coli]|nr:3-hydroxybutyryl-CoA dehydrogenase [Escherichia coli]EFH6476894.1 3-hydroxybutyryl-CoA dehydrogenase [Escherichia coli]EGC2464208.1 3-hydroxybutyryl-CoA dehydrogenase [Escherichia coli]EGJ5952267.1 3-hydroxybutyryl-CoA dehydrogenase [Escherichia coli]HAI1509002.1 3-hydroxybutyryl-CoA dehydrogenase [Escherichia coli]